ncbi:MAG TPA: hypothetical protein VMU28_07250 [Terriglobales bacterium]|nr:hypothetical protein [Terriglobales bacterium]
MIFADLELARRLERAEGFACMQSAVARRRVYPDSDAAWMETAGVYVVFDGIDSPVTQTFGLGMFEEATDVALEKIERFFFERGAPVLQEVSPLAGAETFRLLVQRGYKPIELSNVLYRKVEEPQIVPHPHIRVRPIRPEEAQLWSEVGARGWTHEHPELREFMLDLGKVFAAREHSVSFLAEIDCLPGAAGAMSIHDGVALFAGTATIPELRRRGLQAAMLHERMRYAFEHGCDLAMMVALPGSESQRNAERKGFRVAYTRTKWELKK